ncbi:thaumatin-like protein 1b [Gastrolobium bilobum]|uniref:thaumatin-like protein 1b n=1 Tax=Gastrolobium bilobum TaxID=150636 RepID=UPI002AB31C42|nr:thaumatin-like protein 1b [Gastrolobium bilobum]XP_061373304.1 thaumatin-like protein 1b [Gastrolobium bilobum]
MDQLTLLFSLLLTLHLSASGVLSTTFTLVNKCDYTVWPGILSNAGVAPLSTTGFALQTGESKAITTPTSWGGRFWGRTLCTQDTTGKFSCATGDCGSGKIECAGSGATPPATLAEFTLDGSGGLDFFDVSLVDGYNLPMLVVPQGGSGDNCTSTGCVEDLNGACPSELKVASVDGKQSVACKSACEAFGSPQYCCSGAYGSPNSCKPSAYSQIFKNACPRAYSYAYDDKTSTFTCGSAADYTITFCPSHDSNPSQKSSQGQNPNSDSSGSSTSPQLNNGTMVYVGALDQGEISWATCTHVWKSQAIAFIVSITMAIWLLCHEPRFYA